MYRLWYIVYDENGKDGLAYLDFETLERDGQFLIGKSEEFGELWFPVWRVVEVNDFGDEEDEEREDSSD